MEKYTPYWPVNVLIVGAGATSMLGMDSTAVLGKGLLMLAKDNEVSLQIKIQQVFSEINAHEQKAIEKLFRILEGEDVKGYHPERIKRLREVYDWQALKQIVKRCPGVDSDQINIQDVYNLIDMHIQTGHGFSVDDKMIPPERMSAVRNTVNMYTTLRHAIGYRKAISENKNIYEEYYTFARYLGLLMQQEGVERHFKHAINTRDFYLFSYSVISMNWDPIFLWLIFNAHKELNEKPPFIGVRPSPMKLFHDMAHFMAVRGINEHSPQAWFPMNETAVQRLNDPEHSTGRRVRIGKFYFPHGCHGFRECPNCGKLTFYLGNDWNHLSDSLFPPQIIKEFSYENTARSAEEKNAHEKGMTDAVQCTHCGKLTEAHHAAIVMQTNFKGNHPPYIEEIQRDMKVSIEKANHFILFGYSFPEDDFIYRSIFAARKQMGKSAPKCSIVNFDANATDKWMYSEDMQAFSSKYDGELTNIYKRMIPLFGKENIRVYGKGIPNVFMYGGDVDKDKVKQLMNWQKY